MRLIDADALHACMVESYMLLHKLYEDAQDEQTIKNMAGQLVAFAEFMMRVKDAPTIDAELVVRCRECKYARPYDNKYVTCLCHPTFIHYSPADGYCYLGKKTDGGAEDENA